MSVSSQFIHGEYIRTLDERFRLSIPQELLDSLAAANNNCVLVKERPGCLSLWPENEWKQRSEAAIELIHAKLRRQTPRSASRSSAPGSIAFDAPQARPTRRPRPLVDSRGLPRVPANCRGRRVCDHRGRGLYRNLEPSLLASAPRSRIAVVSDALREARQLSSLQSRFLPLQPIADAFQRECAKFVSFP